MEERKRQGFCNIHRRSLRWDRKIGRTSQDFWTRHVEMTANDCQSKKVEHGTGEVPCSTIITSVPRYQKGGRTCVQVVPGKIRSLPLPYSLVSTIEEK